MQPSLQLFYLIRSLDASEAKYVRAYAKRKVADGTASLELFDLIHRCKEYDEELFAKKVDVSNFPALKVYVRDLIADAILEKEMKKKGAAEVMALIGQIEIFHKKGFMQLMWARMEKALLLCERYELFHMQRDLLYKKHNILMVDVPVGYTPDALQGFDKIYEEVKAKHRNLESYLDLEEMVTLAPKRGYAAMQEVTVKLSDHPLMADDAVLLSVRAELRYCYIKRNILRWGNRMAEAIRYSERVVQLLDSNPKLLADEEIYQTYVNRVYDTGWYAAAIGEVESAIQVIDRLKTLDAYPVFIFERIHSVELRIALHQLDLEMGEKVIDQISNGLKINEFKMSQDRKVAYYYQVAHFYLSFSLPDKALKWVMKLREAEPTNSKKDLLDFAEILYLICHFDLGNYKFLKRETIKSLGYLQKRGALTEYEEAVIRGLRKVGMATTEPRRTNRLVEFASTIDSFLIQDKYAYKANYFQFNYWIDAKRLGGTPADYMKGSSKEVS